MNFNLDTAINNINYLRYMESQEQENAVPYKNRIERECPKCGYTLSALSNYCPVCGYDYENREI